MEGTIVSEQQSGNDSRKAKTLDSDLGDEAKKPRIDWEDPNIPVGNAPPLPRWPLAVTGLAWLAWGVFLVVMMLA